MEQEHEGKSRKPSREQQILQQPPPQKRPEKTAEKPKVSLKVDTSKLSNYNFLRSTNASKNLEFKRTSERVRKVRQLAALHNSSRLLKATASSLAAQNELQLSSDVEAQLRLARQAQIARVASRLQVQDRPELKYDDSREFLSFVVVNLSRHSSMATPPMSRENSFHFPELSDESRMLLVRLQANARGWLCRNKPSMKDDYGAKSLAYALIAKHVRSRSERKQANNTVLNELLDTLVEASSLSVEKEKSAASRRRAEAQGPTSPSRRGGRRPSMQPKIVEAAESVHQIQSSSSSQVQSGGAVYQFVQKLKLLGLPPPLTLQRSYGKVGSKSLRVFLSSTFRDMQAEREALLKRYIPALRQLLSERGVYLTVVDLRWGVTTQQTKSGETVDICLSEVAASNYFVSFLGHRAGWRPSRNQLSEETFANFPFIKSRIPGSSVTELEVIYGALGWGKGCRVNPRSAFFYVRKEEFLEQVPPQEMDIYYDTDKMAHIKPKSSSLLPFPTSHSVNASLAAPHFSVRNLKRRIIQRTKESEANGGRALDGSTLPQVECYREYVEPTEFAEHVYRDLLKAIERDYPSLPMASPLDAEFIRHISFARPLVRAYVGQRGAWAAIDKYCLGSIECASIDSTGGAEARAVPFVLHGPAGCGKTAAVANWILKNKADGFVLPHFVGCSSNSSEPAQIVRRVLAELKRAFELEGAIPQEDRECLAMLPLWLARASAVGRVIIFIDGLDELRSEDDQLLGWLPANLPADVRIVLSTQTKSMPHSVLTDRGALTYVMKGFTPHEKKKASTDLLALARKSLEPDVQEMIINASQTSNPLFLRLVLEELKASAVHETVQQMTRNMLNARDAQELCQLILQRFEGEFGKEQVSLLYSLIYMSRFGMTEDELSLLLGMAPADWSPFFLAARETLNISAGRLHIGVRSMQLAIKHRYISSREQNRVRQRLLAFFEGATADLVSPARRVEELPFHMMQSNDRQGLLEFCLDISNVRYMLRGHSSDLRRYWLWIGSDELPQDMGTRYLKAFEDYGATLREEIDCKIDQDDRGKERAFQESAAQICSALGAFLFDVGMFDGAHDLLQRAFEIERKLFDNTSRRVAESTWRLGKVRHAQGLYDEALKLYFTALAAYKSLLQNDSECELDYARTLVDVAEASKWTSDIERAKGLCITALKTFRTVYGEYSMQVSQLYNKMAILSAKGGRRADVKDAKKYLRASLKIVQHLHGGSAKMVAAKGDPFAAEALHTLGKISGSCNQLSTALSCLAISLSVYQKIYGPDGIETAAVLEDYALCLLHVAFKRVFRSSEEEGDDEMLWLAAQAHRTSRSAAEVGLENEDEAAEGIAHVEKEMRVYSEKEVPEMLQKALEIRIAKQPVGHIQIAHTYIYKADWHWFEGNLEAVNRCYTAAIDIISKSQVREASKEVAQLSAWVALCHAGLDQHESAVKWNDQACALARKVYGPESWQLQRVLRDKAFILEESVAERDDEHRSLERLSSLESRKTFSLAERMSTQAEVLRMKLKREKVRDDTLMLSSIAPKIRLAMLSREWNANSFMAEQSMAEQSRSKSGGRDERLSSLR